MSSPVYRRLREASSSAQVSPVQVKCITAATQSFPVDIAVTCKLRIDMYTWKFQFYVVEELIYPVILGSDFLRKTGLLVDIRGFAFFRFDPTNKLSLVGRRSASDLPKICLSAENGPDLSHLAGPLSERVSAVIDEFPDVLTPRLGLTTLLEYDIELLDHTIKISPYRLMPPKMGILRQHIQRMLEQGIIRPSTSRYSSPIFLIPKGQDEFRPVVDYRALNKIKIESIPLPDRHSCFHWFKSAKVFTSLDLNSTYHQIGLTERSKSLTAFATDWNLYEYTRVQFGIATGDQVFSDVKFKFVFHYLDDLVIYSNTFQEHLRHLRLVFTRLRQAGL
jgi:hypothetical protein